MRADALARALVLAAALAAVAGCARTEAPPPPIVAGTPCAHCGMDAGNLRFACEQRVAGQWRVYDSIECLAADSSAGDRVALADYDTRALHDADSLAIVHGAFSSPMGGGYAAFLDRAAADSLASARQGRRVTVAEARVAEARP